MSLPVDVKHQERFLAYECRGRQCLGVLSLPLVDVQPSGVGVVIVVGGPQYRVGSHRHFVHLARSLADHGNPVLRFDFRGMGDSEGDALTFEDVEDDLRAAVDALVREAGVSRVMLWGLCDGASAALMFAADDERIVGIVALNPWARSPQIEATAKLKHYYLGRIVSADFRRKLLSGHFRLRDRVSELLGSVSAMTRRSPPGTLGFLDRMEEGWVRFGRPVLFILSGRDLTAREFEAWVAADADRARRLRQPLSEVFELEEADHTFSSRAWRDRVNTKTLRWIEHVFKALMVDTT